APGGGAAASAFGVALAGSVGAGAVAPGEPAAAVTPEAFGVVAAKAVLGAAAAVDPVAPVALPDAVVGAVRAAADWVAAFSAPPQAVAITVAARAAAPCNTRRRETTCNGEPEGKELILCASFLWAGYDRA
ncbi:MAG: hypothetical protein LC793_23045, partial [Thermomicrobia bacterium]|nr:hypothetical protein [Thermomicrobia bacterium]